MRSRLVSVVSTLFIAGALVLGTMSPAGADPTPGCATHDEWDQVDVNMRPFRIEEIIGNDGWFIDTPNPDTFARGYNLCWTSNFGKVWFDSVSNFSFRKAVIDTGGRVMSSSGFGSVDRFRASREVSRTSFERVSPSAVVPVTATAIARTQGKPGTWDNRCWGKLVTMYGTHNNDTINGGPGNDVIFGYAGDDVINGGDGNDRICGRWGDDPTLIGGSGYDRVSGGGAFDLLCIAEETRLCP